MAGTKLGRSLVGCWLLGSVGCTDAPPREEVHSLALAATCTGSNYEAETITHSTGGSAKSGWNIWSNGYISTSHTFAGGTATIVVWAAGTSAQNVWPHMLVSVGSQIIGEASVNTSDYAAYTFTAVVPAGSREIRVQFDNDYYANNQDRNLLVDRFTISCEDAGGGGSGGSTSGGKSGSGGAGQGGNAQGGVTDGGSGGIAGGLAAGGGNGGGTTPTTGNGKLSITSDWGTGYCANVNVSNPGQAPASSWRAQLDTRQSRITNAWNAKFSGVSGQLTVTPIPDTEKIAAGASINFGFCASTMGAQRALLGAVTLSVAGGSGGSGGSTSSGGSTASGGTGGVYQPPTGGYVIKSSVLKQPDLAIARLLKTADFYAGAIDLEQGGFYTYLNRQGQPTSSNKSFVAESRDAYAFVRAFMLSGDEHYLDLAEHALKFLYEHGWDTQNGGFYFLGNRSGAKLPDPSGTQSPKWSFVQHYGLVGVSAMCEATRSALDCGWLDAGRASLHERMWDGRAGMLGYYSNANIDFSSRWDKGFTPTIDGITTHVLADYLISGGDAQRARFLALADAAADRMVVNMSAPGVKFAFPEEYDSNWNVLTSAKFGFVGHIYKTAWCLARAYMVDPQEKYRSAARKVLYAMYETGGFDKQNGAPNYSFNWDSGVNSTDKEYWQLEQAILSGLYNYAITSSEADRALYLEVADRSLEFYTKHLTDQQFGGIFFQTNASGSVVRTDKGDQWEGAYHDTELSYYLYLDANLRLWRRPVQLYYRFDAQDTGRSVVLTPTPIADSQLAIVRVTRDGAPYTDFDAASRTLRLPSGTAGVFGVTYQFVAGP